MKDNKPLRRAERQHTRGALLIPKSVNPLGVPADLKSAVKKIRPIKIGGFAIPQHQ